MEITERKLKHHEIGEELKKLERKMLSIPEAYGVSKAHLYSTQCQDGFINFSLASNAMVSQKSLSYMPSYLDVKCCGYGQAHGPTYLRNFFAKFTPYIKDEILVVSCLNALFQIFAFRKKMFFPGDKSNLAGVFDFSEVIETQKEKAQIIFLEIKTIEDLNNLLKEQIHKTTIAIVPDLTWVTQAKHKNLIFAYEHKFQLGFKCAVCFIKNPQIIKAIYISLLLHPFSTLYAATFQATHFSQQNRTIEKEFMDKVRNTEPTPSSIQKMLQLDSGYTPSANNLFIGTGSTVCLRSLGCVLFNKGDKLGVDIPFYYFFIYDFSKSGIVFSYRNFFKGTLLERVKQSYQAGEKGYLIVSPHNPTGLIISNQELSAVYKWGVEHPDYHLILDEIYKQSIHEKGTIILSSIQYADKYPNFHLIRGFSKDFGLCGFRQGFLISCNQKVKQKFNFWEPIIKPQPYLLHTISLMLQKSNFAQQIYAYNQICLLKSTQLIISLLNNEGIDFIEPKGGYFLLIDLNKYLEKHPEQNEESIWKKLFYDYRVTPSCGKYFETQKPGMFRLCYLIGYEKLEEGIKRIGMMLREEKIWFNEP